jgi:hypothetical protein
VDVAVVDDVMLISSSDPQEDEDQERDEDEESPEDMRDRITYSVRQSKPTLELSHQTRENIVLSAHLLSDVM